jgi:hypothetical protein
MKFSSAGYYTLTEKSPAIDKAISTYPPLTINLVNNNDSKLLLDFEGQQRLSNNNKNDIGCDEFSAEKIKNRQLKRRYIGPPYLAK